MPEKDSSELTLTWLHVCRRPDERDGGDGVTGLVWNHGRDGKAPTLLAKVGGDPARLDLWELLEKALHQLNLIWRAPAQIRLTLDLRARSELRLSTGGCE